MLETILYETIVKGIPVVAGYNMIEGEIEVVSIRSKLDNSLIYFDEYGLIVFKTKCITHFKNIVK